MELIDGIFTRRSVRSFVKGKKIEKEHIEEIIKAGQYAPSAHNKQPWEFLVIESEEMLKSLKKMQPYTSFAKDAACVILVCGDENQAFSREKEGWTYIDIDCAAATQNMILAAHGLGYGACWCGCSPMSGSMAQAKEFFDLPENIKPFSFVVLGHVGVEPKQPETRFDKNKIHWYKW